MIPGKTLIAILTFVLGLASFNADAIEKVQPGYKNNSAGLVSISPDELNRSVEEVINRREFAWRMPRERLKEKDEDYSGPFAMVIQWMGDVLGKGIKAVMGLVKKMIDWFIRLFPDKESDADSSNKDWVYSTRLLLVILLAFSGLVFGYFFWKTWKKRHALTAEAVIAPVVPTPDFEDDGVRADEFTANRWLGLAEEFAVKGSFRLAMRAFYLATLSHLAENDWITIEIFKSNSDYETELKRRAHEKKEILAAFSQLVSFFDRGWYGMYHITRSDLNSFAATQQRIMALAEK